jgi:purine-binding chemotaxis protein CheW
MKGKVQLLIVIVEGRPFGLLLPQVDRVVRAMEWTPLPRSPQIVLGAIDLRGEIIPLFDFRTRFGLPKKDVSANDQFVIARTSRRTVALVVEEIKGLEERDRVDVVGAERILPRLDQIEGAIQLDQGLTLIHDLNRFLSLDEERQLDEALSTGVGVSDG